MAKSLNHNSSTRNQLQRTLDRTSHSQTNVLASCYSVNALTSMIDGFHYCATTGAGEILLHSGIPEVPLGPKSSSSPPFDLSIALGVETSRPGNFLPEHKEEAVHAIPGECERLFCDNLSSIFLGERRSSRQELLGVGVSQSRPDNAMTNNVTIEKWFELLNYTNDTIHRGFVTNLSGEQTLFVFFAENTLGHSLKTGLIALFELAHISAFGCSQIVACVPRSHDAVDLEAIRNLGWCGFNLTTLQRWIVRGGLDCCLSAKWLFLDADV
ncbi:ornithine decarboxylase antizyme [Aspergillus heteromorphus CBS 117.55]|uniref:Ornithine decarboxylase antizyme n=1 Tax=Aspergillus heteromorphus CBS 117.55 TaxID=1448321 RepID=A0A317UR84_9EURO|nr:ornithine decarboxylase antizyme [Aspergillus heteromorphus CBS 117.55]PWY64533.1 ornithine decarboxylase antizyme [Aspergillus heteromorphus CBS 117.55]